MVRCVLVVACRRPTSSWVVRRRSFRWLPSVAPTRPLRPERQYTILSHVVGCSCAVSVREKRGSLTRFIVSRSLPAAQHHGRRQVGQTRDWPPDRHQHRNCSGIRSGLDGPVRAIEKPPSSQDEAPHRRLGRLPPRVLGRGHNASLSPIAPPQPPLIKNGHLLPAPASRRVSPARPGRACMVQVERPTGRTT
jgi:hypothetical protein